MGGLPWEFTKHTQLDLFNYIRPLTKGIFKPEYLSH